MNGKLGLVLLGIIAIILFWLLYRLDKYLGFSPEGERLHLYSYLINYWHITLFIVVFFTLYSFFLHRRFSSKASKIGVITIVIIAAIPIIFYFYIFMQYSLASSNAGIEGGIAAFFGLALAGSFLGPVAVLILLVATFAFAIGRFLAKK